MHYKCFYMFGLCGTEAICVIFVQLVELGEDIQVWAPLRFPRLRHNLIGLKWRTYYTPTSCNRKLLRCCSEICAAGIVFRVNCLISPRRLVEGF